MTKAQHHKQLSALSYETLVTLLHQHHAEIYNNIKPKYVKYYILHYIRPYVLDLQPTRNFTDNELDRWVINPIGSNLGKLLERN